MPDNTHPFSILRQSDSSSRETSIAAQHAMMTNTIILPTTMQTLSDHSDALRKGHTLPIGTVEFVRRAMHLAGIMEPPNYSYPEVLYDHLHRHIKQMRAGNVIGRQFVKPVATKVFTGFVFDTLEDPENPACQHRVQYNEFLALPPTELVWVGEPVVWLSEYRYYVMDGQVLGYGRYDDGPDNAPIPDAGAVEDMAKTLSASAGAPAAYVLDVGVLDGGETALVECNDAWAVGYYTGTLSPADYVQMLWARWSQLATAAHGMDFDSNEP